MSFTARLKTLSALAAATTAILFGLSTHHVHAQTAVSSKFTSAHIASIEILLVDDDAPDEKRLTDKQSFESRAPAIIKKSLQGEGLQIVEDGAQQTASGLVSIRATVKYNPGNQALRWVGGMFGAGKGTIDVHMEAIDPVSGKVIASLDVKDTKRMGGAGGNFYEFADSILEDIAGNLGSDLAKIK